MRCDSEGVVSGFQPAVATQITRGNDHAEVFLCRSSHVARSGWHRCPPRVRSRALLLPALGRPRLSVTLRLPGRPTTARSIRRACRPQSPSSVVTPRAIRLAISIPAASAVCLAVKSGSHAAAGGPVSFLRSYFTVDSCGAQCDLFGVLLGGWSTFFRTQVDWLPSQGRSALATCRWYFLSPAARTAPGVRRGS